MDSQSQIQPPPESLLAPLLELRNYYAQSVEKYEKLYKQGLENLKHVEALLSNWSSQSSVENKHSTPEVTTEVLPAHVGENGLLGNSNNITETSANLVEPIKSEVGQTNDLEVDNFSQSNQNIEMPLVTDEVVTTADEEKSLSENSDKITDSSPDLVEPINSKVSQTNDLEINESPGASTQSSEEPALTSTVVDTSSVTQANSGKSSDIPMLEEYQSLSRSEAIQKILQKYAGSMCHIDMLVRLLYGELEADVFKLVKGRVQSTLTKGRESGKWFLVPGKPGYFTLDLKLLNSKSTSSSKQSSKQGKNKDKKPSPQAKTNSIPMQGEFEGKFLIDAITSLLQQNPRKVFDVAQVINQLYGKLNPEQVQQVKSNVLSELSRGYRAGRFSRVPSQKGLYIWDSKLLPSVIRK
ncbi:hypothetical protein [Fischerella sp. PCC 9605]|uniref:hypothetical protein n=1 Tax=Fischerella sp. PCC 9605 TaxID=1173024 RepID=UPI00047E266B|nr:hypothetical protein [Fischerella sp. PCC 9605]